MRVTLCSPSAIPHGNNLYRIPWKPIPRYIESSLHCPMKKDALVEIQKATFHFATHGQKTHESKCPSSKSRSTKAMDPRIDFFVFYLKLLKTNFLCRLGYENKE